MRSTVEAKPSLRKSRPRACQRSSTGLDVVLARSIAKSTSNGATDHQTCPQEDTPCQTRKSFTANLAQRSCTFLGCWGGVADAGVYACRSQGRQGGRALSRFSEWV